jgi:hypothetical protein
MTDRRAFVSAVAHGATPVARAAAGDRVCQELVDRGRAAHGGRVPPGGLKETGYVEGQNVTIEFRSAEDDHARLSAIVAELVRRPVVLVTNSTAARLAKAATTTIPIVVATGGDPVRDNLVASCARRPPDQRLSSA